MSEGNIRTTVMGDKKSINLSQFNKTIANWIIDMVNYIKIIVRNIGGGGKAHFTEIFDAFLGDCCKVKSIHGHCHTAWSIGFNSNFSWDFSHIRNGISIFFQVCINTWMLQA